MVMRRTWLLRRVRSRRRSSIVLLVCASAALAEQLYHFATTLGVGPAMLCDRRRVSISVPGPRRVDEPWGFQRPQMTYLQMTQGSLYAVQS